MSDIKKENTIWFPGVYGGRDGEYDQILEDISLATILELVKRRAEEDGEWTIANGYVGDNEDKMRRMMAWVSDPINIEQCVGHVLRENLENKTTVDWVCRDLANASKYAVK